MLQRGHTRSKVKETDRMVGDHLSARTARTRDTRLLIALVLPKTRIVLIQMKETTY